MIIIDANIACEFSDKTDEARQISAWIARKGAMSVGGKNLEELVRTPLRDFITQLDRAGKLFRSPAELVDLKEAEIAAKNIRSDDAHVLALAVVGGARLLYTKDAALIIDFINTDLVPRPRGRCYRYARKHKNLLN